MYFFSYEMECNWNLIGKTQSCVCSWILNILNLHYSCFINILENSWIYFKNVTAVAYQLIVSLHCAVNTLSFCSVSLLVRGDVTSIVAHQFANSCIQSSPLYSNRRDLPQPEASAWPEHSALGHPSVPSHFSLVPTHTWSHPSLQDSQGNYGVG